MTRAFGRVVNLASGALATFPVTLLGVNLPSWLAEIHQVLWHVEPVWSPTANRSLSCALSPRQDDGVVPPAVADLETEARFFAKVSHAIYNTTVSSGTGEAVAIAVAAPLPVIYYLIPLRVAGNLVGIVQNVTGAALSVTVEVIYRMVEASPLEVARVKGDSLAFRG